jgi:hypothetical protein
LVGGGAWIGDELMDAGDPVALPGATESPVRLSLE